MEEYCRMHRELGDAIEKCPLNNDWVYKMIGWYNLTPFYKTLVAKLIEAG